MGRRSWLLAAACWLAFIAITTSLAAQEVNILRLRADELYKEGAFADAAQQWVLVAEAEPRAVDARINAAQAYLQADDLGRAMLYFRRAQALDPRHPSVQLGIALVRALRVDILSDESGVLSELERLSVEVVTAEELAWLTVLAWSCAFGFGTAAFVYGRMRLAAAGFAIIALALLVMLIGRGLSQQVAPSAVVTAFETVLISEPGESGVSLSRLYSGAEARIAGQRDGWTLITLSDGRAGWLPEADVAPLAE